MSVVALADAWRAVAAAEAGLSNAERTAARFSSDDLIAPSAGGAPGADSCSVRSGSPSQITDKAGRPSFQRTSATALAVQASRCKCADGNGPSPATIGVRISRGSVCPAKSVAQFFAVPIPACRSSKRPTVFALAITVRPPAP